MVMLNSRTRLHGYTYKGAEVMSNHCTACGMNLYTTNQFFVYINVAEFMQLYNATLFIGNGFQRYTCVNGLFAYGTHSLAHDFLDMQGLNLKWTKVCNIRALGSASNKRITRKVEHLALPLCSNNVLNCAKLLRW